VKVYGAARVAGFSIVLLYLSPEEVMQRRMIGSRMVMYEETECGGYYRNIILEVLKEIAYT
jgi:hypothetical protein